MWTAIYKDRSELKQFDGDKENMFSDIDQDNLLAFRIDEGPRHIILDMKLGVFVVNGTLYEIPELSFKKEEYRLIYFRRVQESMGTAPGMTDKRTNYFVGFQMTIDGTNRKTMFSVDDRHVIRPYVD